MSLPNPRRAYAGMYGPTPAIPAERATRKLLKRRRLLPGVPEIEPGGLS